MRQQRRGRIRRSAPTAFQVAWGLNLALAAVSYLLQPAAEHLAVIGLLAAVWFLAKFGGGDNGRDQ